MQTILLVGSARSFAQAMAPGQEQLEVLTAATGEEALKIHRSRRVSLIVTELDLPDLSAELFCATVRSHDALKHVSLLALCTGTEEERAISCGANAHLVTPAEVEAFLGQITRLLAVPERKKYRVLLRVTLEGQIKNASFFCTSQDLSASGLLLESDRPMRIGSVLACSFFLPGSTRLELKGRVVREEQASGLLRYGVRFEALSGDQESAILAFVGKHPSEAREGEAGR